MKTISIGFCLKFPDIFIMISITTPRDELACMKLMTFSVRDEREDEMKEILQRFTAHLTKKGYNPINQLVGYILSEDPTYITAYKNARSLIRHIDRDELLQVLVKSYLGDNEDSVA